ncbi:MAG: HAMP domain-containing sensor histidine kinase [Planctomycetota bacterium]
MRLRTRLTLVFCAGAAAILVVAVVLQSAILGRHARIESQASARGAVEELQRSLQRRMDELTAWGAAAEDLTQAGRFVDALADLDRQLGIDSLGFVCNADGTVAWRSARVAAALARSGDPTTPAEFEAWLAESSLIQGRPTPGANPPAASGARVRRGVILSPLGPMVGVSSPIGRKGGELVLLRPFEAQPVFNAHRGVAVEVLPRDPSSFSEAEQSVLAPVLSSGRHVALDDERGTTSLCGLSGPDGQVALIGRARAQRADITLQRAWVRDTTAWMLVVALVGLLSLLRFLDTQVLGPVRVLEQHASRIGRTDHGRVEMHLDRNDELGDLARSLNGMLRSFDVARQEVVRSARHMGMSDISKGVVHSIGNVLTSVNVSTHVLIRELANSGAGDMRLLIDELRSHQADLGAYVTEDPNGRFLLPFLDAMTTSLEDFQSRCAVELEAIEKGIQHVVQLVRSMDRYSTGGSLVEEFDVETIVEAAIGIACLAQGGAHGIEIVREFGPVPRPTMDRHKLTTVLIHLISNALDALNASPLPDKRLEIAVFAAGHDRFVIEITDTGMGIPPEHLDSIFTSGFTTKAGSAGEGLHIAGNLCREMGVSIGAVSEGAGTGATFKLRLPYRPPVDDEPQASEPPSILPSVGGSNAGIERRRRAPRSS